MTLVYILLGILVFFGLFTGSFFSAEGGIHTQELKDKDGQIGYVIFAFITSFMPAIVSLIACFANADSIFYMTIKLMFFIDALFIFIGNITSEDKKRRPFFIALYIVGVIGGISFLMEDLDIYAPLPVLLWKIIDLVYAVSKIIILV